MTIDLPPIPSSDAEPHDRERIRDARERALLDRIAELEARPVVPEGYALVPVEPTEAMFDALRQGSRRDYPSDELCRVRFAALLAAAKGVWP